MYKYLTGVGGFLQATIEFSLYLLATMLSPYQIVPLAALLPTVVLASIGPVADLHIVNKNISPDGFSRESVVIFCVV